MRREELEHMCADCLSWCEVWDDDGDGMVWTSCTCGGGYESRAGVARREAAYRAEWCLS